MVDMYSVFYKLMWLSALSAHEVHVEGGVKMEFSFLWHHWKVDVLESREGDEKRDFLITEKPPRKFKIQLLDRSSRIL